ncbi:hypothetical protein ONZ45_g5079 [Pleurotus djamor]|nr:hypothetical protein ONZ45_g5079 [Pleurotus djamor]
MPPPSSATSSQPSTSSKAVEVKARGANRSTKVAGKLKVLPEQPESDLILPKRTTTVQVAPPPRRPLTEETSGSTGDSDDADADDDDDEQDEELEDVEVYNQLSLIPDGTARRDALKLTKKKAKSLPRVTAYATASSYRIEELVKFFNARKSAYHTDAKLIDEVLYTPYVYDPPASLQSDPRQSKHAREQTGDLLGIPELLQSEDGSSTPRARRKKSKFDVSASQAEIFLFSYGTVVIWGMTEAQEKRFLASIKRFEVEKLLPEDVEMEDLNYYYANYSRQEGPIFRGANSNAAVQNLQ